MKERSVSLQTRVLNLVCESRTKDTIRSLVNKSTRFYIDNSNIFSRVNKASKGALAKFLKEKIYMVYASNVTSFPKYEFSRLLSGKAASLGVFIFLNMLKSYDSFDFFIKEVGNFFTFDEWLSILKNPKQHESDVSDFLMLLGKSIAEPWEDFKRPLVSFMYARENFKNVAETDLRRFANLDPMKMTFQALTDAFAKVSRFFNNNGLPNPDFHFPIKPRPNQELVGKVGKFLMYKLTKKEQCNDPYFSQGATYCVTTKNFFGSYGGPPYYVIMKEDANGYAATYAALIPSMLSRQEEDIDVSNLFRNATNTEMLSPAEAKPIAALIRKAVPAKALLKALSPRSGLFFYEDSEFIRLLATVYGRAFIKRLRFKVRGVYTPAYYKGIVNYLAHLGLRRQDKGTPKFINPDDTRNQHNNIVAIDVKEFEDNEHYRQMLAFFKIAKKLARYYRIKLIKLPKYKNLPKKIDDYYKNKKLTALYRNKFSVGFFDGRNVFSINFHLGDGPQWRYITQFSYGGRA